MARAGTSTGLTTSYSTIFEAGQANDGKTPFEIVLKHISSVGGIDIRVTPTHINQMTEGTPDALRLDSSWSEVSIFDAAGITKVEAKIASSGSHELRWAVTAAR